MASKGCDQLRHPRESTTAKSDLEGVKPQQRVTRTRVNGCKFLEFMGLGWPLWIRRVLVRAQEGQLEGPASHRWCWAFALSARCYPFCYRFSPPCGPTHELKRRLHDLQPRRFISVLIAREQRVHIFPPAGGRHVLEREVLPLCRPFPSVGVPEPTIELLDSRGCFGLPCRTRWARSEGLVSAPRRWADPALSHFQPQGTF
jgi:hypothetical protein